jgi:hypothetical protein
MNISPDKDNPPFIILSAEKADKSAVQNCVNTAALTKALADSPHDYAAVIGRWQGKHEKAVLVLCPLGRRDPAYTFCLTKARAYNQDTILYVDERLRATIEHVKDSPPRRESIGTWRRATAKEAVSAGAITVGPDGNVWIAAR